MLGTLYIVATPIGNLEDITLRAIKILSEVDIILAEDTRVTKKLLDYLTTNHQLPTTKVSSYHHYSPVSKKEEILLKLLQGKNIAVVSDAGTPGISDPGNELIDFILEREPKIKVIPIPGASAVTTALSVCGFRTGKFVFIGFLPKKKRTKLFNWLKEGKMTFGFYESPKRILKTLNVLSDNFGGQKRTLIARELTKLHETLYRGTVKEVTKLLSDRVIKGEIVVVVELS